MGLLTYLLQAGFILAVLTLCYRMLLRRATRFALNRYLLWLNALLAVGLPLVELPDFRPEPVRQLVRRTVPEWSKKKPDAPAPLPFEVVVGSSGTVELRPAPEVESAPVRWLHLLNYAYLAGVGLLLTRLLVQVVSLIRLIRRSERSWDGDVWLVSSPEVGSPFSFFRWIVLNPALYEPDELDQILLHERIHSDQWHSLDMLAAEGIRILFWFNPFAWWHRQLVQENLEYLVDREVLAEGVEKKMYQYYLLKASLSEGPPVPFRPAANSFHRSGLANRIRMMNLTTSWRSWVRYGAGIAREDADRAEALARREKAEK
ncbi:M56 family metallopeptidase [Larkinella soli]|uniref:M56 family metallopeptidase n=1 Tax=Larkinella soli TaxID=1770527 RepID=UPI000FFC5F79|nr:M56 family metallopeptidase [Larkinella soli]